MALWAPSKGFLPVPLPTLRVQLPLIFTDRTRKGGCLTLYQGPVKYAQSARLPGGALQRTKVHRSYSHDYG